jgi:electron transport complex protein RnfB
VIEPLCTGCELCVPVCPVDCIVMVPVTGERTGWQAWSGELAGEARERYAFHRERVERERRENDERLAAKAAQKLADLESASTLTDPEALARKRAVVEAAMQRARAQRGASATSRAAAGSGEPGDAGACDDPATPTPAPGGRA